MPFARNRFRIIIPVLAFASFGLANVQGAEPPVAAEPETGETPGHVIVSADDALRRLLAGNRRFVETRRQHPHESKQWRVSLESGQHPQAVVVGCSDSRVCPELIFDQGLGDLFVIRVAGNVIDTDVVASVEYAVDHLHTQLVIVLGHSGCGAVTAALAHAADSAQEPDEVASLLYRIEPALVGIPADLSPKQRLKLGVSSNVERSVQRLRHVPDLMKSLKRKRMVIIGAVYDMHTGKVTPVSRTDALGYHPLGNTRTKPVSNNRPRPTFIDSRPARP